jgi:hypothetical protein
MDVNSRMLPQLLDRREQIADPIAQIGTQPNETPHHRLIVATATNRAASVPALRYLEPAFDARCLRK